MTKSELIQAIASSLQHLPARDVEVVVNTMFDSMTNALQGGDRIEIRGFGSFALRFRKSRTGRNPKSGESVNIQNRYVPHFKPGKEFRESVKDAGNHKDSQ